MDTSKANAVLLICVALLAVAAATNGRETAPHVARCRAVCLDQFIQVLPTDQRCQIDSDCLMCWESCALLHENYRIWGSMCTSKDMCSPGCQRACSTLHVTDDADNSDVPNVTALALRSLYNPQKDRVTLEWGYPQEQKDNDPGSRIYVILLRENLDKELHLWEEIAQTTSNELHVKRGLLRTDTEIRLLAVSARGLVADVITPYVESLVASPEMPRETDTVSGNNSWQPKLQSLRHSFKSIGVQATVSWPTIGNHGVLKYEVSWNVIDDAMEITGHLYTGNTMVVLTLWPEALYSVQVQSFSHKGEQVSLSEPLVIDTRRTKPADSSTEQENCLNFHHLVMTITLAMVTTIFFVFILLAIVAFHCHLPASSRDSSEKEKVLPFFRYQKKTKSTSKLAVLTNLNNNLPSNLIEPSREKLLCDEIPQSAHVIINTSIISPASNHHDAENHV